MLIVMKKRMMSAPQMRHNQGEREMRDETTRAEKVTMPCTSEGSATSARSERGRGSRTHPGDGDDDPVRVLLLGPQADDAEEVMGKLPCADDLRAGMERQEVRLGHRTSRPGARRGETESRERRRTWRRMCEHRSKLPTTQLAYRAQGLRPLRLRHRRKTHVNIAPATGQVEAISPRTAASDIMKRPESGQAMAYIEPPPASRAVRTPRVVPAGRGTTSA